MKSALLFVGLMAIGSLQAQEDYRRVLVDDPYMCNGYFIKDVQKCQALGVKRIDVEILGIRNAAGNTVTRTLQTFSITDGLFGKVDNDKLAGLLEGERAYYHLRALDVSYNPLVDYTALPIGGGAGEKICSSTCQAPTWAWSISAWENDVTGKTTLTLGNAASPYGYYYFYVPQSGTSGWNWWIQNMDPYDYGLSYDWSYYGSLTTQVEVVKLNANLSNGTGGAPAGAKNWLGYDIPQHTPVYGIRKDRGPYRVISASREMDYIGGNTCDIMQDLYNAGPDVQQQLAQYGLQPIWCPAMPSTEGIGGEDMDPDNPFAPCTGLPVPADGNLFNWMNSVLDCIGNVGNGSGNGGGSSPSTTYATVLVNRWYDDGTTGHVFGVDIPDGKDPKLIQVDKTELLPGLYEFVAVLNNGQVMRHFEAFDQPRTINADFADFINVNIYPVPVTGQEFAVDIDLLVPSQVTITIVNNMGTEYYSKTVNFDQAGRNKHVVEMGNAWPNGIYHAIFQYGDGSSTSRNFSVD